MFYRSHISRSTAAIFHFQPKPFLTPYRSHFPRSTAAVSHCLVHATRSRRPPEVLRCPHTFSTLLRGSQEVPTNVIQVRKASQRLPALHKSGRVSQRPSRIVRISQAGAQVPRGRRDSTGVLKVATASPELGSGHQIAAIRRSRSYSVVRGSPSA